MADLRVALPCAMEGVVQYPPCDPAALEDALAAVCRFQED